MTNLTDQFFAYDKRTQRAIIAAITNEECNAGATVQKHCREYLKKFNSFQTQLDNHDERIAALEAELSKVKGQLANCQAWIAAIGGDTPEGREKIEFQLEKYEQLHKEWRKATGRD